MDWRIQNGARRVHGVGHVSQWDHASRFAQTCAAAAFGVRDHDGGLVRVAGEVLYGHPRISQAILLAWCVIFVGGLWMRERFHGKTGAPRTLFRYAFSAFLLVSLFLFVVIFVPMMIVRS
jgi:hypothetical protein